MPVATMQLADFAADLAYKDLPADVLTKTKLCLLDVLACGLSASKHPDIEKLIRALRKFGGHGTSTVWGQEQGLPLGLAVLANSSMAHTLDFDDFHKKAKVHGGTTIIPAVLTAAEALGSSYEEVICATVAGYEVMLRVAMALDAKAHRLLGWHGTAVCGTFGAAAAVGKLLGLDALLLANALGTAGTQSGGLWAFTEDGAMTKKFHAGKAAWSGTLAALLSREGFTGATRIFEAKDGGFLPAFSKSPHYERLTEGLGCKWEILNVGFKPYACCRTVQPAIEAAIVMRQKYQLTWPEILKYGGITVFTYGVAKRQNDLPLPPPNPNMAQFNLPFLVALALREGNVLLEHFNDENIQDPELIEVAQRVRVLVDEKIEQKFPEYWSCRLELGSEAPDGPSVYIENAKGDPVNPLSMEEHRAKFCGALKGTVYEPVKSSLAETVLNLDSQESLQRLLTLLRS